MAMNANRMLGITQGTLSGSTEKLSSGYRINRAADDAAGLSISEKMRKQIRGLDQASANAEDGISSVQTAEGALQEVTDMLQRMNELAVQAANGTNSATDRQYIQDEIDQLITEVDRVAETTKFNETYLLKGDTTGVGRTVYTQSYTTTYTKNTGSNKADVEYKMNYTGASAVIIASASISEANAANTSAATASIITKGEDITKFLDTADETTVSAAIDTDKFTAFKLEDALSIAVTVDQNDGALVATNDTYILDKTNNQVIRINAGESVDAYLKNVEVNVDGVNLDFKEAADGYAFLVADTADKDVKVDQSEAQLYDGEGNEVSGVKLRDYFNDFGVYTANSLYADPEGQDAIDSDEIKAYVNKTHNFVTDDLSFSLHVGADSASTNKIITNIKSMSAASLGINVLKSTEAGIVDATGNKATDAIDVITDGIYTEISTLCYSEQIRAYN